MQQMPSLLICPQLISELLCPKCQLEPQRLGTATGLEIRVGVHIPPGRFPRSITAMLTTISTNEKANTKHE